jgi:hypothetical protein
LALAGGGTVATTNTPTITGQADPFVPISIFADGGVAPVGMGSPDSSGAFSVAVILSNGQHTLTAKAGSPDNQSAASDPLTITVESTTLTTSLLVSAASGTYGGTVTLSAALSSLGTPVAGETVSFTLNSVVIGTASTDPRGIATLSNISLAGLNVGTFVRYVGASFGGDAAYQGSIGSNDLTITARPITVTAAPDTKTYDGTTSSTATPTITSGTLAAGDTANFSQAFDSPNAGTGKTLTPSGSVNDGNAGNNYSVTFVSATGTILQANVTIVVSPVSATYDGSAHGTTGEVFGVGGADLGSASITYSSGGAPVNAGSYTATGSFAGNGNYNAVEAATSPFSAAINIGQAAPSFSNLSGPGTAVQGATVTFTGHLGAGSLSPGGEAVSVTLGGITQTATLDAQGDFSVSFSMSGLAVSSTPYAVTYSYGGDQDFNPASDSTSSSLSVTPRVLPAASLVATFDTGGAGGMPWGTWYVGNRTDSADPGVTSFVYGGSSWAPVAGDWDGDGVATVGVVDTSGESSPYAVWMLRNSNSAGAPDIQFAYGMANWAPVAGDWNGDGTTTPGVVDETGQSSPYAVWMLRNSNSAGAADVQLLFGLPGWVPVAGDWDGDGIATPGMFDPATATWYLRQSNDPADPGVTVIVYGGAGWKPVAGDWNADGVTSIGVVDPDGVWHLRDSNSAGAADHVFAFGLGSWTPVAGAWGLTGATPAAAQSGGTEGGADLLTAVLHGRGRLTRNGADLTAGTDALDALFASGL